MSHSRPGLDNRLVVVANRLPVEPHGAGWRRSLGGLVTAVAPMVEAEHGAWVGWNESGRQPPAQQSGIQLYPVDLPSGLAADYYNGFSNSTIWPAYHDCLEPPEIRPEWWTAYCRVNAVFAAVAAKVAARRGTVWVHDYQLQLVPALIRRTRPDLRIGFYLHVPVPTPEAFQRLPHGAAILRGMLGADVIGVQRECDVAALRRLADRFLGLPPTRAPIRFGGRRVQVDAFPAAVDVAPIESLSDAASQSGRVAQVRAELGDPRTLVLAVERLDFTKGVEHRLEAYRGLLADGRLRAGETVLVQVLAPSRLGIPRYQQLRARVAELIARINAEFGPAVHYIDHFLPIEDLVPLYRAADVMAVTPLRDGMNLVAKEFVASRTDFGGRLVLSRYAGAVDQLGWAALLVDPHDVQDVQGKLMQAIQMGPEEAARRMRELRASFVGHDANQWGRTVLDRIERSRRPTAMRVVREPDTAPPRRRGRHGPSTMDIRG